MGFDRPRKDVWEAEGRKLPAGSIERAWKGGREGSWLAYTHPIKLPTLGLHPIDRNLLACGMLGITPGEPDCSIPVRQLAAQRVDAMLSQALEGNSKPKILMTPGTLWETKHWMEEGFSAVARHFIARGFPVLLTGAPNEAAKLLRIADAAPGAIRLETSLAEMAELMRRSAIVLANDSGPLHLATALGRTAIALFGPTNPEWVGPYRRPDLVISARRACSPCFLRNISRCGFDHACMHEIKPEQVIKLMEENLAGMTDCG